MTALSEFEKLVSIDLPSVPAPLVTHVVKRSIIEFCEETFLFNKSINFEITTGVLDTDLHNSVDIDLSNYVENQKPHSVIDLRVDGQPYDVEYVDLVDAIPDFGLIFDLDKKQITFMDAVTIRVHNLAVVDRNIYLRIAFKPTMAMTEVDDVLYDDWVDPIVAGAKHRLMTTADSDMVDAASAADNRRTFRRGVDRARNRIQRNFARQISEVRWRAFGGVE